MLTDIFCSVNHSSLAKPHSRAHKANPQILAATLPEPRPELCSACICQDISHFLASLGLDKVPSRRQAVKELISLFQEQLRRRSCLLPPVTAVPAGRGLVRCSGSSRRCPEMV